MISHNPSHVQRLILVIAFLLSVTVAQAQQVSISPGKTEIGLNEVFQLTITVENDKIKEYSPFPDIPGMNKGGVSTSTSTQIINGQMSISQSITQSYVPTQEGSFVLRAFQMSVNGQSYRGPGATVKVGPPTRRQAYDPFADLWGDAMGSSPKEFVDVKEDAFFSISANKREVFVGEGFTVTIAFYVALSNQAQMEFYKIGEQLTEILGKIKPANCWEENFGIESVNPEYVTIGGKQYRQFKIYQATFFPLSDEPIRIPSAGLQMVKYKVARNPSFFGMNRQEDFKTFYSKEQIIKVKDLPPHPLKDRVSVGNYKLVESRVDMNQKTGDSFVYSFKVQGEGNISAIAKPIIPERPELLFYPPNESQQITRANETVYGSKKFDYYIEPHEPGNYNLRDYINWVFFNPRTARYDTLSPDAAFSVAGESVVNSQIARQDLGVFYERMAEQSNRIYSANLREYVFLVFNLSLLVLLVLGAIIVWRKPARKAEVKKPAGRADLRANRTSKLHRRTTSA